MANQHYASEFYEKAARAEISSTLVSKKGNVCPFAIRLAWHASGTYDASDGTGGSDGATMRFDPEVNDPANAGLALMQDIVGPVRRKFPDLSVADLWTLAGAQAVALTGGPAVPFRTGRKDDPDGANCPPVGRLPDASQGAQHLRDVFYRMGFGDKEIVALSGAHTLGSCHRLRSGFDGPWTTNPLKFDNEYFKNLLELEWKPRDWDGPLQYSDPTGKLMMLPTDLALVEDDKFRPYVQAYAEDEQLFFKDFAEAFAALLAKGCPASVQPASAPAEFAAAATADGTAADVDKDFRDLAMHGSLERMKALEGAGGVNVNSVEAYSKRTALHKAAFFGHAHVVEYLLGLGADPNARDADGDAPLHDAARLGHAAVVRALLAAGADRALTNADGKTPSSLAAANDKTLVVEALA